MRVNLLRRQKKNEEQSSEQAEKGKIKIKEEVTAMRHNLENL